MIKKHRKFLSGTNQLDLNSLEKANRWRRILAGWLDAIIVIVFLLLTTRFLIPPEGSGNYYILYPLVIFLAFTAVILYEPVFISSRFMATPGFMIMGLIVVTDEGNRLSLKKSFRRLRAKILINERMEGTVMYRRNLGYEDFHIFLDYVSQTKVMQRKKKKR